MLMGLLGVLVGRLVMVGTVKRVVNELGDV
jgi:hypothetical protein